MSVLLEEEFNNFVDEITKIRNEDPLKAIYLLEDAKKHFILPGMQSEIDSFKEIILFQIKKNNLKTSTSLDTLSLINSLKNKKMDYFFMLNYNELKTRDIEEFKSEFQYFFNSDGFDNFGFQTLIYDLLQNKNIDYDYKVLNEIINPSKDGSFLKNEAISKLEKEILYLYKDDISKSKVARQVFSAFLFNNWVDILKNKTKNEYEIITNVTKVLIGEKDKNSLNENELSLYERFK